MRDNSSPIPRPKNDNPMRDGYAKEAMRILLEDAGFNTVMTGNIKSTIKRIGLTSYAIADSMMQAREQISDFTEVDK